MKYVNPTEIEFSKVDVALAKVAIKLIRKKTSFHTSPSELRDQGNPYGRGPLNYLGQPRGPIPHNDASIIHWQSGRFNDSWEIVDSSTSRTTKTTLRNTAPYAPFFMGTSRMIRRPLMASIMPQLRTQRSKLMKELISSMFKESYP